MPGDIPGRSLELSLYCLLTDEEVSSRGRMLGETVTAIDECNSARTQAMKEFKDRLTGLTERQRKLACIIRDRTEERMVQCAVLFHAPEEGIKRVVRMDTGEIVHEIPMSDAEKQLNLFAAQEEFREFLKKQGMADTPNDGTEERTKTDG